jgi:hypothetical protein
MSITNFQGLWAELLYFFLSNDGYYLVDGILCSYMSLTAGRIILIILDNAGSHDIYGYTKNKLNGLDSFELSKIKVVFLPPNITSVVQPLDQGIIAALKIHYKHKLVEWTLQQFDSSEVDDLGKLSINVLQAMLWCIVA